MMAQMDLAQLRIMAENGVDLTQEARRASERDRDYYDHHQWSEAEKKALASRKQAAFVSNRIQRKVDAMVGLEQRFRTDPRALPRHPGAMQAADVASKVLVFADDLTRFDHHRSAVFENLLVEGYGAVEIGVDAKMNPTITRIRWEELFFDPHSREKDFSDAAYIGVMKWMTIDRAQSMYAQVYRGEGEADTLEVLLEASMTLPGDGATYEDRPYQTGFRWADQKQKRVRVAQMYYQRGGTWYLAIFTGGGMIYNEVSPYQDEDGRPVCAIEAMTGYIDRENRRYGIVRSMIPVQDEVNARRSRALHLINTRQTTAVKGAVSVETLKRELAKPDGHVEIDIESAMGARDAGIPAFQVLQTSDMAQGNLAMLQEAKAEIDMLGPNAALLGQAQGQQSGRAIMAQQQAGMAELAPLYDSLRDFTLRCYRAMWARVRQFWTDERYIRITGETQAPQFIAVNQVTGFDPMTMQPMVENAIAKMDVDIMIDEAPDHVTLQAEQFEQLSAMAQAGIPIPPEVLIEASSLRDKPKLLQMMQQAKAEAMQAQQAQMQAQQQAAQQDAQLKQMDVASKADERAASAMQKRADVALKVASVTPPPMMMGLPAAGV